MTVRGMAHAVALTWRRGAQDEGGMLRQAMSTSRGMNSALRHLQSYCVGVLQAAVLSLIHNVEAPALVVCAIRPTGNLTERSMYTLVAFLSITIFPEDLCILQILPTH